MFQSRSMFTGYSCMNKILEEDGDRGALWLGDFGAASDKRLLKEKGIKTVLTTASGLGITYLPQDGIVHHQYNLLDIPSQNISHCFDATYKDIDEGLKRGGVLVHCAAGISRSATCLIAYLMRKNNTNFHETLGFVRNKRRIVCPNFGFEKQLKNFEAHLNVAAQRTAAIHGKSNNMNKQVQIGQGNSNGNNNQLGMIGVVASTPTKANSAAYQQSILSSKKEIENAIANSNLNGIIVNNTGNTKKDTAMAEMIANFNGKKLISNSLSRDSQRLKNVRLEPMSTKNMAELIALKLSQNDPELKILGVHKLLSPGAVAANSVNKNNFKAINKDGRTPPSLLESKYNNIGPNIVTYSAQGELRTSSRGPIPVQNRMNSQNSRVYNYATMTRFRKYGM